MHLVTDSDGVLVGLVLAEVVPVDGIVSRKRGDSTSEPNVLIRSGGDEGLGVGGLVAKGWAVSCSDAVGMSSLEQSSVGPSHDEITVQAITSGITISKSKVGDIVSERAGVVEELVEEREEGNWVRLGTHSSVVVTNCGV